MNGFWARAHWGVRFATILALLVAHGLILTNGLAQEATPVALSLDVAEPDPTVTALEKAKLHEEVEALQRSDEQNFHDWLGNNINGLVASIGTIAVGLFAVYRYFNDKADARESRAEEDKDQLASQAAEREQRAQERFHRVVQGLGADGLPARLGAAVTLRSFLQQGDEKFYGQVFDLAAAHLRFISHDDKILQGELATAFRDAYPLARGSVEFEPADATKTFADVSTLQTQYERLNGSFANMQGTHNWGADFRYALLSNSRFDRATIIDADFSGADLQGARFAGCPAGSSKFIRCYAPAVVFDNCFLDGASFFQSTLFSSSFIKADMSHVDLRRAKFHADEAEDSWSDLSGANLSNANLSGADLTVANLKGTNIEQAKSLEGAILRRVRGLSDEQVEACRAKGAIDIEVVEEPLKSPLELPQWLFDAPAIPTDESA